MPAKKSTRQKFDLTNLAAIAASAIPELEKLEPADESQNSTEAVAVPAQPAVEQETPFPSQQQSALDGSAARSLSSEIRGLKTLQHATNASGEVFQLGDKIQVTAPWGKKAIAEIVTLYEGRESEVWAYYRPDEIEPPADWSWMGGCSCASSLVRFSSACG